MSRNWKAQRKLISTNDEETLLPTPLPILLAVLVLITRGAWNCVVSIATQILAVPCRVISMDMVGISNH